MKTLTMLLCAMVSVVVLMACAAHPIEAVPTGNSDVKAEIVAVVDGIKVYRLDVGNRVIYFTDARGATMWDQRQGKRTVHESVETVR